MLQSTRWRLYAPNARFPQTPRYDTPIKAAGCNDSLFPQENCSWHSLIRLDDKHIINVEAISCIEQESNETIKIHFIGRWDNVLTLKDGQARTTLSKLGIS